MCVILPLHGCCLPSHGCCSMLALAVNYTLELVQSYPELLVRTRAGLCDIGWAPFYTISSRMRCEPDPLTCAELDSNTMGAMASGTLEASAYQPLECCVEYSLNYLQQDIAILYLSDVRPSFFVLMFDVWSDGFAVNFGCFIVLLVVISAHAVWLFERRNNSKQFPEHYLDGIDDAFWWAVVTITTVGYGDKVPRSVGGRLVALLWMFLGLGFYSTLSGHVSSALLNKQAEGTISAVRDLVNLRVCGYGSTFSAHYMRVPVEYTAVRRGSVAECGELLKAGEVDAIVMEASILSYWARNDPWMSRGGGATRVRLSSTIASVSTGVVFPHGSPLVTEINPILLDLQQNGLMWEESQRWFRIVRARLCPRPSAQRLGSARLPLERLPPLATLGPAALGTRCSPMPPARACVPSPACVCAYASMRPLSHQPATRPFARVPLPASRTAGAADDERAGLSDPVGAARAHAHPDRGVRARAGAPRARALDGHARARFGGAAAAEPLAPMPRAPQGRYERVRADLQDAVRRAHLDMDVSTRLKRCVWRSEVYWSGCVMRRALSHVGGSSRSTTTFTFFVAAGNREQEPI